MSESSLILQHMEERHPGLTPGLAACYWEAACVCLDRPHHSPLDFAIQNGPEVTSVILEWDAPDERLRRAWANEIDTTEAGAYACALAAVEHTLGLVALGRAETLTGADYHVGLPDNQLDDLERCFRLEVSGVNQGTRTTVASRLRKKSDKQH
jgi:hypothetical protein